MIQLTLTLKMTTAQVVEMSVTVNNNSPIPNYVHPEDHPQPSYENYDIYFCLFMLTCRFPEYILQHLEVMSINPSQRLHQSCCLLYLSYMITLYGLNYQDLKKKGECFGLNNTHSHTVVSSL